MFDYYVKYIINNIEKSKIVILDDFYSDFIEDFILDKLEDLEESRDKYGTKNFVAAHGSNDNYSFCAGGFGGQCAGMCGIFFH